LSGGLFNFRRPTVFGAPFYFGAFMETQDTQKVESAVAEKPWIVDGVPVPRRKMTAEQGKAYERYMKQQLRQQKRLKSDSHSKEAASLVEVKRAEGLEILSEIGLKNTHVIETIWSLLQVGARLSKLVVNDFLVRHGLRAALIKQEPVPIEDGPVAGELSSRVELCRLWDASMSALSFDEWLKERHECKTDCVKLGRLLGHDFFDQPHGVWRDFLPSFNPDTLPSGYSQEQMKVWLASQSSKTEGLKRDFLQLCSRNSYKSTFIRVWSLTAVLCCPDIRLLLCSETTKLVKSFVRSFRAYWERGSGAQNERFHQLFPDYLIEAGDGSVLSFQSPMAHLNLPQETAEVTSLESSSTGSRFDLGIFDDVISNMNTGNEEMREGGIAKFDALQKLKEVGGISITIGTAWHPQDLYAELLKRAEGGSELAVHLAPAWTVKPEAQKKDIHDLVESDIETLLFPSRLTFAFLKKELGRTPAQEKLFRSQNLIEFVSDEEQEVLNFDEDLLRKSIIPVSEIPPGRDILTLDIATSTSKWADLSCITAARLAKNRQGFWTVYILDQDSGRLKSADLAMALARMTKTYNPQTILAERPFSADLLEAEFRRAAQRLEVPLPIFWVTPESGRTHSMAKFYRVKRMEALLPDRLRLAARPYVDDLIGELLRISGTQLKSGRKDDRADSAAMAVRYWSSYLTESAEPDNDLKKLAEDQQAKAMMNLQYQRIFQGYSNPMRVPDTEEAPAPSSPLEQHARSVLGPGFRIWRR
jgi:hypothetical protein